VWELSLKTGLPPEVFETAEDILTVLEILRRDNAK
jgi:hypothetical protein